MSNPTFLLLFLLFDVFLIGVLGATAIQHALAHFKPALHEQPEKLHTTPKQAPLPVKVKEHMLATAQKDFETTLNRNVGQLQHDLSITSRQLNNMLEKLGSEVIGNEMECYKEQLVELRKQAETTITAAQTGITDHQAALKAKLEEDIAAEKQRLLLTLDTKLADAVASFLSETLQHNVDLGAQSAYLTAMLEEHKKDFTREIADEARSAR